jgi:hypothetical protein
MALSLESNPSVARHDGNTNEVSDVVNGATRSDALGQELSRCIPYDVLADAASSGPDTPVPKLRASITRLNGLLGMRSDCDMVHVTTLVPFIRSHDYHPLFDASPLSPLLGGSPLHFYLERGRLSPHPPF